jgi:hypothetical protein
MTDTSASAPAPTATNERERREFWRAVVHEDLRICARDNGLISEDQTLGHLPPGLPMLVGVLASELTHRAMAKHNQRPDLEIQIRRDIRAMAWNAMRIHRDKAPSRAPSGATTSQGNT